MKPTGIAKSLNIGDPAAGPYAIEAVRRTGGWMDYADDDEIRDGIRLLARTTGVFAETAGGVTVAVLKKLVESGKLDPTKETVVFNTGEGLKTLDAVAELVGPTHRIKPSLKAAREAGLLGSPDRDHVSQQSVVHLAVRGHALLARPPGLSRCAPSLLGAERVAAKRGSELELPVLEGVPGAKAHLLVDGDHVAVDRGVEGADLGDRRLRRHEVPQVGDLDDRAEPMAAMFRLDDGDLLPGVPVEACWPRSMSSRRAVPTRCAPSPSRKGGARVP